MPSIQAYELKLDKITNAPQTSSIHVVARNVNKTHFRRTGAFFSDLKKTLKANAKGVLTAENVVNKKSHKKKNTEPLKKPINSYMMFVKEHSETVRQVNNQLRKQWHSITPDIKNYYNTKGQLSWSV